MFTGAQMAGFSIALLARQLLINFSLFLLHCLFLGSLLASRQSIYD